MTPNREYCNVCTRETVHDKREDESLPYKCRECGVEVSQIHINIMRKYQTQKMARVKETNRRFWAEENWR